MRKKTYPFYIIRVRKGKNGFIKTNQIIAILNTKKTSSQGVYARFGYFLNGKTQLSALDFEKLALCINNGFKINDLVKKLIFKFGLGSLLLKKQKKNYLNKLKYVYKK